MKGDASSQDAADVLLRVEDLVTLFGEFRLDPVLAQKLAALRAELTARDIEILAALGFDDRPTDVLTRNVAPANRMRPTVSLCRPQS